MSWVNLNDVYVNQTGGTIAGDLSINGALTVNDGKGTNTTYNVANEITTLRDSVSHIIKTKQISTTTDSNGYFKTGLSSTQIPIGIGGIYNARYAFHTGNNAQETRTIRLMAWDGSTGSYANKSVNIIVYYIEA